MALSKYVFIRNAATHQEQMGGIPRYGRHIILPVLTNRPNPNSCQR
ncbi:hypothetical protein HMPREF1553_02385 [Porphyromonas gingivalis F0568]|nr:hypothetical protein HMPREF1553_02385 [Porphyromonas gingivalis F0568]